MLSERILARGLRVTIYPSLPIRSPKGGCRLIQSGHREVLYVLHSEHDTQGIVWSAHIIEEWRIGVVGEKNISALSSVNRAFLKAPVDEGLGNEPFPVAFVRAGSFYENYLFGLQAAQGGTLPIFYAPTARKLPMVATEDIGAPVAKLLTSEWTGKRFIELGSMVSSDDLAGELGVVLGRDVKAQAIPREAWADIHAQTAHAETEQETPSEASLQPAAEYPEDPEEWHEPNTFIPSDPFVSIVSVGPLEVPEVLEVIEPLEPLEGLEPLFPFMSSGSFALLSIDEMKRTTRAVNLHMIGLLFRFQASLRVRPSDPEVEEALTECARAITAACKFEVFISLRMDGKRKRKRRQKPAHDPASPFPQMVDAKVVAAALDCSVPHVYALTASGRLHYSLFDGMKRFTVADINDYLRGHRVA